MPRLLVVRRPRITRGLAVKELSQIGGGQVVRGPVVELLKSRLDDSHIKQMRYPMFSPQVGREVIAEPRVVPKAEAAPQVHGAWRTVFARLPFEQVVLLTKTD